MTQNIKDWKTTLVGLIVGLLSILSTVDDLPFISKFRIPIIILGVIASIILIFFSKSAFTDNLDKLKDLFEGDPQASVPTPTIKEVVTGRKFLGIQFSHPFRKAPELVLALMLVTSFQLSTRAEGYPPLAVTRFLLNAIPNWEVSQSISSQYAIHKLGAPVYSQQYYGDPALIPAKQGVIVTPLHRFYPNWALLAFKQQNGGVTYTGNSLFIAHVPLSFRSGSQLRLKSVFDSIGENFWFQKLFNNLEAKANSDMSNLIFASSLTWSRYLPLKGTTTSAGSVPIFYPNIEAGNGTNQSVSLLSGTITIRITNMFKQIAYYVWARGGSYDTNNYINVYAYPSAHDGVYSKGQIFLKEPGISVYNSNGQYETTGTYTRSDTSSVLGILGRLNGHADVARSSRVLLATYRVISNESDNPIIFKRLALSSTNINNTTWQISDSTITGLNAWINCKNDAARDPMELILKGPALGSDAIIGLEFTDGREHEASNSANTFGYAPTMEITLEGEVLRVNGSMLIDSEGRPSTHTKWNHDVYSLSLSEDALGR